MPTATPRWPSRWGAAARLAPRPALPRRLVAGLHLGPRALRMAELAFPQLSSTPGALCGRAAGPTGSPRPACPAGGASRRGDGRAATPERAACGEQLAAAAGPRVRQALLDGARGVCAGRVGRQPDGLPAKGLHLPVGGGPAGGCPRRRRRQAAGAAAIACMPARQRCRMAAAGRVQPTSSCAPARTARSAMNSCPVDKARVVILGQDPYHDLGQVRRGGEPAAPRAGASLVGAAGRSGLPTPPRGLEAGCRDTASWSCTWGNTPSASSLPCRPLEQAMGLSFSVPQASGGAAWGGARRGGGGGGGSGCMGVGAQRWQCGRAACMRARSLQRGCAQAPQGTGQLGASKAAVGGGCAGLEPGRDAVR